MEQSHCITETKKYSHLREKDRYKIEAMLERKYKVREVASQLNKHISTIYREINRGSIDWLQYDLSKKKRYRADVGQRSYEEESKNKTRSLKIGSDHRLAAHICKKLLKDRYSPDAILGEIKQKGLSFERMICTKTLYNYIDAEIFTGISNENLWQKRKRKKRSYKSIRRVSSKNRMSRSIEDRPEYVERREEYGHWEGDCVKGPLGTKMSLLTLTERKTLEQIIIKIESTTQEEVQKGIDGLEKKYGVEFAIKFKTITFDNGSEFLAWKDLEVSILDVSKQRTTTYYAHAYSSWERGSNENQNRMIRRFIPKGMPISKVSVQEIKRIEKWMNNYPRKRLNYKSAKEAAEECLQNISEIGISLETVAL